MSEKTCSKCKKTKPLGAFRFRPKSTHKDKYCSQCISCEKKYRRKKYQGNEDSVRDAFLQKRYGISLYEYKGLEKEQNFVCAICKNKCDRFPTLSVDHNHKTEAIRGLLCDSCNRGLGCFKDNIELLQIAIKYLEEAPKKPTLLQLFRKM